MSSWVRVCLVAAFVAAQAASSVWAQTKQLAPGFTGRDAGSKLVVVPADLELFSISAGGVSEPRADWTDAAQTHLKSALRARSAQLGSNVRLLTDAEFDALAEINALHGAVAQSVFLHHMLGGALALPTKAGQLDWSMGEAVHPIREQFGADYALFIWIRDSYASAERKAAMVAMALLGVGLPGGAQVGYASLVDTRTGRVVWFNDLRRGSGDLREAGDAAETVETLLKNLPAAK